MAARVGRMITALIVDDEPKAAARLASLLDGFAIVEVVGTTGSVAEAELFLRGRRPDVVFLDINMPGRLGIDLLPSIDPATKVVFVTASEAFGMQAFEHGAVDYLLKPFDHDRLAKALERIESAIIGSSDRDPEYREPDPYAAADVSPAAMITLEGFVAVSIGQLRSTELVPMADIVWIESFQNYTRLQLASRDQPLLARRLLAEWETILPEDRFARLGRSLLVCLGRLRSTQWLSRDQTLLHFHGVVSPMPIGRAATVRLKEILPNG
jgi:two-component system LytT family response regulator